MKQTAVEWLVEQLKKRGYAGDFPPHLLFEQAKEMEKERIIDAYQADRFPCSEQDAEQYYNETYGGNK